MNRKFRVPFYFRKLWQSLQSPLLVCSADDVRWLHQQLSGVKYKMPVIIEMNLA
jgi:hypothetical protein